MHCMFTDRHIIILDHFYHVNVHHGVEFVLKIETHWSSDVGVRVRKLREVCTNVR